MKTKFLAQCAALTAVLAGQLVAQKGGGNNQVLFAHDSPVIITDGSVKLIPNSVFVDLTGSTAAYAQNGAYPKTLFASHTHAACFQPPAGTCNSSCTNNSIQNLYVYSASVGIPVFKPVNPSQTLALTDCDTIRFYLDAYDKTQKRWIVPAGQAQIEITKRFMPSTAYPASVLTDHGGPMATTSTDVSLAQAWVVAHTVAFASSNITGHPEDMETAQPYRLNRVEVIAPSGATKLTAKASNSCTVVVISPFAAAPLLPPCRQPLTINYDYKKILANPALGHP